MRDAMTAIDERLSPPAGVPEAEVVATPSRLWPRVALGFLLGLGLCLGVAAAALFAWDAGYEGRILPGVRVDGVDLSGMDRDQAMATLSASFAGFTDGQIVLRTDAGDVSLPYARFARRPDVEWMTDQAMLVGRTGSALERAVGEVRLATEGEDLQPALLLDEGSLEHGIRAALVQLFRDPLDARIGVSPQGGIYTFPADFGRAYDVDGATAASLAAVQDIKAPQEVVIAVGGWAVQPARSSADVRAAQAAAERMTAALKVTYKDQTWKIKASVVRGWIGFQNAADGSVWPVLDQQAIASALKQVAKGVKKDAVSAVYLKTRSGHTVGVAASHNGRKLDREATAAAIAQALMDRANGGESVPVEVKVAKVTPKLTTEAATQKAPLMVRLGSWKTWFPISDHNYYGANIWQPARIIDGTVLMPGQTFEWWSAIGPVTTARGFGPGGYIAGDHTDPTGALGGGMCSSSTTLFNAALRAGLQMGSRVNHQYYIYRYPLGLDATVSRSSRGTRTMTFTNDLKHPIVIRTYRYTSGGRGWVRYEIWGIPDGRTVSIGKAVVSNVRKATTRTVYVDTLAHGVRNQTEYPANGMDVSVSRVVRDANGHIIHHETYYSHYQLWDGVIEVGR